MKPVAVDGFTYQFDDGWEVSKFDDWLFYREHFAKQFNGIKAVDLIALEKASKTLWLVEVKDYRNSQRTKDSDLHDEVGKKVVDTLAALLPAAANANDSSEKTMARNCLGATKLRVAFQLEQVPAKSVMFPKGPYDPAKVQLALKTKVRAIDAHPVVFSKEMTQRLPWKVS